ncbi:DUF5018 domain-containing protein [Niastella yeongjuensis]|nr:DUF5018 domain-containing protein [Niastella yeongjuensis]
MKLSSYITVCMLLATVIVSSCSKDKGPFEGRDNTIASFQLKKGDVILQAAIKQDSIVITAPGSFSLSGVTPAVVLSEHARISPDPATITNWEQPLDFVVTSYDGLVKTYKYVLKRNIISKEGDIVLMRQADVDTLAALQLSRIKGSLTIGKTEGADSIYSLDKLSTITGISGGLVINPTYAGKDLKGLENLETIGGFKIGEDLNSYTQGPLMNLKTIIFPKLTSILSSMIVNGPGITSLQMPVLTNIDFDLQLIFLDSLKTVELPKLQRVLQSVIFQGTFISNALETINFPALETIGGDFFCIQYTNLVSVKLPALTKLSAINILGDLALTTIEAPKLTTTVAGADFSSNPALTTLNLAALTKVGGQFRIESSTAIENLNGVKSLTEIGGDLNLTSLPSLKDVSALKTLKKVGGNFLLQYLDQLTDQNLANFAAVNTIGGSLSIISVPNLISVNGLSLVTFISRVFIYDNQNLVDYTGLKNVIPTLSDANWQVSSNRYNPGYQDMVNGNYVAP